MPTLKMKAVLRQVANDNGYEYTMPKRRRRDPTPAVAPATWRDRITEWIGEGIMLLVIAQVVWLILGSPVAWP